MQLTPITSATAQPIQQAELILKLYELRREEVMRKARGFIGGEFLPSSADDLVAQVSAGNERSGFILQVYGYWDMVAAFVIHGALSEQLVYDTCQEMYFQYSKIRPCLEGFREKMNLPEWMKNLQSVAEATEQSRTRVKLMRENIAHIAAARASKPSAKESREKESREKESQ
jgi:hypothetical protein